MYKSTHIFPDLDKYLGEEKRNLVTYEQGARLYGVPFYTFVHIAKEANATFTVKKKALADLNLVRAYIDENPEAYERIIKLRRFR